MDHTPQAWGRPRDDVYGAYDASYLNHSAPKQATQAPVVTGTSVIALKFNGGVVMAADNLASYGSLARFTDTQRLRPFGKQAVLGFSGDVSDMQFLDRHLNNLEIQEGYDAEDASNDDDDETENKKEHGLNAANLHTYLGKLFYGRRNKFDPLWNQVLVAGFDNDDDVFLACVDLRGTTYSSPSLATGYGAALAQPIMRKVAETEAQAKQLTQERAVEVIKECMKVLYYRDARSLDTYSLAIITKDGVNLSTGEKLEAQSWAFAERIRGYGTQTV
ncbi:Proteasome subunit beta type-7 [Sporothrix curviconia]|uniref:Proteasome subunit beta n=1 Tax=Sporothrix curviconia TaxID=1260050 RepID=A0ABP0BBZ5_9PEZI